MGCLGRGSSSPPQDYRPFHRGKNVDRSLDFGENKRVKSFVSWLFCQEPKVWRHFHSLDRPCLQEEKKEKEKARKQRKEGRRDQNKAKTQGHSGTGRLLPCGLAPALKEWSTARYFLDSTGGFDERVLATH